MGWLNAPIRLIRDLPIGFKLAMTVAGALSLLVGVSWFALDRLRFVTAMQLDAAAHAAVERQVQHGLITAQELRVIARELQAQQTVTGIRSAFERAEQQTAAATKLVREIDAGPDRKLVEDAVVRLNGLMDAVRRAATLRSDLLTARQKRLFQARPTFETAMTTLFDELARGAAMGGGVAVVRDTTGQSLQADQRDPTIEAANRYRLAMSRIQGAALMFMATGNGSAANDVRDATSQAASSMATILSGPAPDDIKADAHMVDTMAMVSPLRLPT
jgi:hypothetical protein